MKWSKLKFLPTILLVVLFSTLSIAKEKCTLINFSPKYDSIIFVKANPLYNKDFYWTLKDGKWGILNAYKKEIVPCIYDIPLQVTTNYDYNFRYEVSNPIIMLGSDTLNSVLVDIESGIISPPEIEDLSKIGTYTVFKSLNKKYGLLDSLGKIVIPAISETPICWALDSLLLLRIDSNYFIYNKQNQVKLSPDKITENLLKKIIGVIIKNGACNGWERFDFDTININENELALAFMFFSQFEHREDFYEDTRLYTLRSVLDYFVKRLGNSYCDIDNCFRNLDEWYVPPEYPDVFCGLHPHVNSDNPYFSIKGFGNGIIEYCYMDLEASAVQVYFDMSYFTYCKITGNTIDTLTFKDLFPSYKDALKTINIYFESLMGNEEEIINSIDSSNRIINESNNFYLTKSEIIFLIPYENKERMPLRLEDQLEFAVPYSILEINIPNGGIIRQIQDYNPPDN